MSGRHNCIINSVVKLLFTTTAIHHTLTILTSMTLFLYIQVPARHQTSHADELLKQFLVDIPVFDLVGDPHEVVATVPYAIDADVQLVCKYLKAYDTGGKSGINRLYTEGNRCGIQRNTLQFLGWHAWTCDCCYHQDEQN